MNYRHLKVYTVFAMDVEWIRKKAAGLYVISAHAREECAEEDISLLEVRQALLKGEILEEYASRKDARGKSYLMLGYGRDERPVHVVVARVSGDVLRVVTAYLPKPPKWLTERKRGV